MSIPSRNRNLLIIIGVLLLTNMAVLVYFLGAKKRATSHSEKDRSSVAELLQKEVGFSDEQVAQYKQLKEEQRETIRPMYDDMRKAKENLFKLLSYPQTSDSVLNQAADNIAQKQKALDMQTFNHFKRVKALCTPGQQPKYDSMVQRMIQKMGKPPPQQRSKKN